MPAKAACLFQFFRIQYIFKHFVLTFSCTLLVGPPDAAPGMQAASMF
jgi:hypothetical protein